MSRIRLDIDQLVLKGFEPREGKAVARVLEAQLQQVLANPEMRNEWARSHRTPVLKLGRMPLQVGSAGAAQFGKQVANAVERGLKP
jgi:hypothetical protein